MPFFGLKEGQDLDTQAAPTKNSEEYPPPGVRCKSYNVRFYLKRNGGIYKKFTLTNTNTTFFIRYFVLV